MRNVLLCILFTFSIGFLPVNIQTRVAYPNWLFTNEFANNFSYSSLKNFLILRNAWSLNLAVLYNVSMWAWNFNLSSIVRPSNSTSVVFLISMAFILRMKHLSSLGPRIINWNLSGLAFIELYLNQFKIFVMSYLRFDMTVPNSLSQL